MAEGSLKRMTQDGIFKMVTWDSRAVTDMFGLPAISGPPLQQEMHEPVERKLDRFFPLEDGSFLNIEHQTRLDDREALAERMIGYRLRARARFPLPTILRQVVVYTGARPTDRAKVPTSLTYADRDPDGMCGTEFGAPIRDLLVEPLSTFRASGRLDDLLLGMLGPGRALPGYQEEVAARIRSLRGERLNDAKVKFVAICLTLGVGVGELVGDVRMWIEDVKDSPLIKEVVRIAGREELEARTRQTLAEAIAVVAQARGFDVPDGFANDLTRYADESQLRGMMAAIDDLDGDIGSFVDAHGVHLPGYGA